jgi:hypothetical protein
VTLENEKILIESFPNVYKSNFQFECGDGWFQILYELSEQLEKIISNLKANELEEFSIPCASQVKEKYGTLRFYTNLYNDEVESLIEEAEAKTSETCEMCGKFGTLISRGRWYMVRCVDCK